MLIDWFTVGAQALNFIILVWLLRRYLYKPILAAVDAREKKIAAELADAAAKGASAGQERDALQKKNEELDRQRDALLAKATDDASKERKRLFDEARKAADAASKKRRDAMMSDAKSLNDAIAKRTLKEVFAVTRRALSDLAGTSLEERIAQVFIRRLGEMDDASKSSLGEALMKASSPTRVRSAFELPPEPRRAIQDALNRAFSADLPLQFESAPEMVSGIELVTDGHKVCWSIADYLVSLEKEVEELVAHGQKADAQTTKQPEPRADAKATPERGTSPVANGP